MDILTLEHLSKAFGSNKVIDDLSLSIPEHSVFGLLGPNGSGKTTTMKMVLGLLKPTSGRITVCGEPVTYGQTATNRHIGYLPDVPQFYGYMRPHEYLKLCGEITGLSGKEIKKKSDHLLTLVGLDKANKKIAAFSRGMRQRLGIAQALLNDPKLLICDEPTSALDPIGRKEILDILEQVKGKTTVVFSTHILSDVERICDRVAVIHQGKIALSGLLSEIKTLHKQDGLFLEFSNLKEKEEFISQFGKAFSSGMKDLTMIDENCRITLHVHDLEKVHRAALQTLLDHNILPAQIGILEPTLERLFMEVVK